MTAYRYTPAAAFRCLRLLCYLHVLTFVGDRLLLLLLLLRLLLLHTAVVLQLLLALGGLCGGLVNPVAPAICISTIVGPSPALFLESSESRKSGLRYF